MTAIISNTIRVVQDLHVSFGSPAVCRDLHLAEWNCRAGQNNVIIRTDGSVAPCFPKYASPFDWGTIDKPKFDGAQLADMKKSCQRHCFSTLNHNLAYCYDDSRVIKFVWTQLVKNRLKGGARSFDG